MKILSAVAVSLLTAFSIPHGCENAAGDHLPVIAQSAVFPKGNAAIAFRTDTNEPVDLSDRWYETREGEKRARAQGAAPMGSDIPRVILRGRLIPATVVAE